MRNVSPIRNSLLFLLVFSTWSCSITDQSTIVSKAIPKQLLQNQILVTLSDRHKQYWKQIARELSLKYKIQQSGEFPLTSIAVNCLVYKVPNDLSIDSLLKKIRADHRVVMVQRNQIFNGVQGKVDNVYNDLSYGPRLIHADRVQHMTTGKGVKIAVIDTGADVSHPELVNSIIEKFNFVEGGEADFSLDKHGTAISGVIGAAMNNGIGIDGIAPDADILIMKSCWYEDRLRTSGALCSSWTLAKALDAAINQGVNVINLSLAGKYDPLLESLLIAANRRGISVVAASLEKAPNPGFPAQLKFVIPVISAKVDGSVVNPLWLNQMNSVIPAPGVEIITTAPRARYDVLSGSSLATAHVSGVIALLLEQERKLAPAEIKRILIEASFLKGQPQPVDMCKVLAGVIKNKVC